MNGGENVRDPPARLGARHHGRGQLFDAAPVGPTGSWRDHLLRLIGLKLLILAAGADEPEIQRANAVERRLFFESNGMASEDTRVVAASVQSPQTARVRGIGEALDIRVRSGVKIDRGVYGKDLTMPSQVSMPR